MLVGFPLLPSASLNGVERRRARQLPETFPWTRTTGKSLERAPAYIECSLVDTIEKGDHSIFVGKLLNAGVHKVPAGRPDDATFTLRDLGEKVFYGG